MNKYEAYLNEVIASADGVKLTPAHGSSGIVAKTTFKMEPTKAQDKSQFSKYATGEYVITVQQYPTGRAVVVYAIMRSRGIVTVDIIPNEMLESSAFTKLNKKSIELFNANQK